MIHVQLGFPHGSKTGRKRMGSDDSSKMYMTLDEDFTGETGYDTFTTN